MQEFTEGQILYGNFGAMCPVVEMEIVEIIDTRLKVKYEDLEGDTTFKEVEMDHVHSEKWKSANGSSVGIYVHEVDAY